LSTTWTSEQLEVIAENRASRQLVQAGPGTGKTAVACARVAHLIEQQNVLPHEIFIISFTNAAIHEIRNRIKSYLTDPELASGLRITTLDSFAASLQSGFVPDIMFSGDFTQNIKSTSDLIFSNPEALEYIRNVQHLIVDEAQDISGARTELLLNFIYKFEQTTGVTIFYDSAQAIYGFAGDGEESFPGVTLPIAISQYNEALSLHFSENILVHIHRTQDKNLIKLFDHGRVNLNTSEMSAPDVYLKTREIINKHKHYEVGSFEELVNSKIDLSGALVLFRSRVETLNAAASMGISRRRIRLPEMPTPLEPWIARVLSDWGSDPEDNWDGVHIEKQPFLELFPRRIPSDEFDPEYAWELLLNHAGVDHNRASLHTLVQKLSRKPPLDFCLPEFGHGGPIFSTIHRAKGREANDVYLYMPEKFSMEKKSHDEILEEARVLFVGATRSKSSLGIGKPKHYLPRGTAPSGRAFTVMSREARLVRFEIGRKMDLEAFFLVGQNYVGNSEAYELQRFIWDSRRSVVPLNAYTHRSNNGVYKYEVKVDPTYSNYAGKRFGWFGDYVTKDLWAISNYLQPSGGLKVPEYFLNFQSLGACTMVVPPDSKDLQKLHHPWNKTGLVLAPLLSGFPVTKFPFAKSKRRK